MPHRSGRQDEIKRRARPKLTQLPALAWYNVGLLGLYEYHSHGHSAQGTRGRRKLWITALPGRHFSWRQLGLAGGNTAQSSHRDPLGACVGFLLWRCESLLEGKGREWKPESMQAQCVR